MFLIVGYVIILAGALGTYAVHGSLAALWVPMEYIAIVCLLAGAFVASNDIKVFKPTLGSLPSLFKVARLDGAATEQDLALPFADATDHQFRIMVMNRGATRAHVALQVVAGRNAHFNGGATLRTELHDG